MHTPVMVVRHELATSRAYPFVLSEYAFSSYAVCVGSEQGDPVVVAVFVEEDVVVEFAGAEEFDPVVEVGVHLFVSGSRVGPVLHPLFQPRGDFSR